MKKIHLLSACVSFLSLAYVNSHAQNTFPASGEVHISYNTYVDPAWGSGYGLKIGGGGLAVNGNSIFNNNLTIGSTSPSSTKLLITGNNSSYVGADLNITRSHTAVGVGQGAALKFTDSATNYGSIIQGSGTQGLQFFVTPNNSSWQEMMRISTNGNIGIGTTNPQSKLAVNGTIQAQEVKVTTAASDWPDYVFKPDYKLISLDSLSKEVQSLGHLPGMPSTADIEKNGLGLSDISKKQQQKIEELTLYVITLNNRMQKIEEENDSLKLQAQYTTDKQTQKTETQSAEVYNQQQQIEQLEAANQQMMEQLKILSDKIDKKP